MKLSLIAIITLRFICSNTEQKQVNQKGDEVPAPRLLNGEQSAQRRHFFVATKEIIDKAAIIEKKIRDGYDFYVKDKVESIPAGLSAEELDKELRKDREVVEKFNKLQTDLDALFKEEHNFDISDKTKKFLKECFSSWSSWSIDDDFIQEEISEKLK